MRCVPQVTECRPCHRVNDCYVSKQVWRLQWMGPAGPRMCTLLHLLWRVVHLKLGILNVSS